MTEEEVENGAARNTPPISYPPKNNDWIHLTEGKQFSRLLYPNPVCFLCTMPPSPPPPVHSLSSASGASSSNYNQSSSARSSNQPLSETTTTTTAAISRSLNVMVVTWLTATNNHGQFIMSLNRRRHTASFFELAARASTATTAGVDAEKKDDDDDDDDDISEQQQQHFFFTLCVPVRGMEDLVRTVGGTSGRWGSKFLSSTTTPADSTDTIGSDTVATGVAPKESIITTTTISSSTLASSRRQQKKRRRQQIGVPGLRTVPLGQSSRPSNTLSGGGWNTEKEEEGGDYENDINMARLEDHNGNSNCCFAIEGTIAHLKCRTTVLPGLSTVQSTAGSDPHPPGTTTTSTSLPLLDDDHYLIVAQVVDAYCHESYWDTTKCLFRPMGPQVPPYLTFLGSQTFGHVQVQLDQSPPP